MIHRKLQKRHAEGRPIRVAWIGAGRMNTGAICQTAFMKGIFNSVICDIRPAAAQRAYEINGFEKNEIVITDKPSEANDAIRKGKPVITQNTYMVPELEIDCIVEGTGVPDVGAQVAYRSIQGCS
jgi:predicted homoserine dehydrogenase-like protein